MRKFFISYIASALVFCTLDLIWLSVARNFYVGEIGSLLLAAPRVEPALAFYVVYLIGIVSFAVLPAIAADSLKKAFGCGALLGLVAYATYDLSNLATLQGWTTRLALVDIAWGIIATAIAAACGFALAKRMGQRFE